MYNICLDNAQKHVHFLVAEFRAKLSNIFNACIQAKKCKDCKHKYNSVSLLLECNQPRLHHTVVGGGLYSDFYSINCVQRTVKCTLHMDHPGADFLNFFTTLL